MKPLNPIMAALVIASVGALPLRTHANDGKKPAAVSVKEPVGVAVAVEDTNSITTLTDILAKNPSAVTDAGNRISAFLLNADADGKSFVSADAGKVVLAAEAQAWAKKQPAGNLAMLYFVVGPGADAPSWVKDHALLSKTLLPKRDTEDRLRKALIRFTVAGGAQIVPAGEKDAAAAFLNTAADEAKKVFDDPRPKPAVDASVERNDNTAARMPNTGRGAGSQFDGGMREYTLDDLYGPPGAVVMDVSGPDDKNPRKISMKIFSRRLDNDTIVNEIGIFDVSNPADIYGQRFPVGGGDQTFVLDDRTPGHRKYELKFGNGEPNGDRSITFGRPGGGVSLKTKVSDLYLARAEQAAGMNNIITIAGKDFYALPQGGAKSVLMMFPKEMIDARRDGDARRLGPALYAEVGGRGSDGRNENVKPGKNGGPKLGKVGEKDYHLEFNQALGVWEVKEGVGDVPAPAKTDGGNTDGGNTDGGNTDGGANPAIPGGRSVKDLEDLLLKAPNCKKNLDDTKDLAANLKDKYGLIACVDPREGQQVILIVPKTAKTESQQMVFGNSQGYKLLRGRFVGHYLVLQFDKQAQYLDLLKKDGDGTNFALSGFVADKSATKFTDTLPFADALKNYMGIAASSKDAAAIVEVPKRVAAALGSKPYNLTGSFDGKEVLIVSAVSNGDVYPIWPKVRKPGAEADPTPNPYTSLSGPANAMDGAVVSTDEKFPADIKLADSRLAKAMAGRVTTDIALYESVTLDDKPEPKRYFVMFKYYANDPKDPNQPDGEQVKKIFRQKPFEVFNSTNPLPDNFDQQGLVSAGAPVVLKTVSSAYRFISDSNKERGVLAVFQNKQVSGDNQKDKAGNCVGPIIWWGLKDRDAALKACQDDKF